MCDENITASPSTFERVSKIKNIAIEYDFPIVQIKKDKMKNMEIYHKELAEEDCYLLLTDNKNKEYSSICGFSGIFVAIGMKPNTKPLEYIHFLKDGYIVAGEDCCTSLPGLFAAGDVRTKQLRQSITATSDGANAVQSAINYLKNLTS